MARLHNIEMELHDLGFFDEVVLGAMTFKVNVNTLYPDSVSGFFDMMPRNGTPGGWRSSSDSCPVCELSLGPETAPSAPTWSLDNLLALPGPSAAQAFCASAGSAAAVGSGAHTEGGPEVQGPQIQEASASGANVGATASSSAAETQEASASGANVGATPSSSAAGTQGVEANDQKAEEDEAQPPKAQPPRAQPHAKAQPPIMVQPPLPPGPPPAKPSPPVLVDTSKASQPLAKPIQSAQPAQVVQQVQEVQGPTVAMPQQPLAQPLPSVPLAQGVQQVQGSMVPDLPKKAPPPGHETPAEARQRLVHKHLHELALDMSIWDRPEWQGWDRVNASLRDGYPIQGLTKGNGPSVQGLALGFYHPDCSYDPFHLHKPCDWIKQETLKMAEAVHAGLMSISKIIVDLGCGDGKPEVYRRGAWGWHCAVAWSRHIKNRVLVFGPMMSWHFLDHWTFKADANGKTIVVKMVQGPDTKASASSCSQQSCRAAWA